MLHPYDLQYDISVMHDPKKCSRHEDLIDLNFREPAIVYM